MRLARRRPAHVTALLCVCLFVLFGVLALGMDAGRMLDERRRLQAAADAAALAAAKDCSRVNSATASVATTAALNSAANFGISNDGINNSVSANMPPTQGSFAGSAGYVEVIVQSNLKGTFSRVFTQNDLVVTARAVAALGPPRNYAVLTLDASAPNAFSMSGSTVTLQAYGAIGVNSNAGTAFSVTTPSGSLSAAAIDVQGGASVGNSMVSGTLNTGVAPAADPLASLTPPDLSDYSVQSSSALSISKGTVTLQPGIYQGGITIAGQAQVTLAPGIYIMNNGGFQTSGQASVTANQAMIYNTGSAGQVGTINIAGQGTVSMSPPTSGPYAGMQIFQDPSLSNVKISITGNGNLSMSGIIYNAGGPTALSGNASAVLRLGTIISDTFQMNGNASVVLQAQKLPVRNWKLRLVE